MISLFLQSESLKSHFDVSFSYRYSPEYEEGFQKRVKNFKGNCYPLSFIHLHSYDQMPIWLPLLFKRIVFAILQYALLYPLLLYEIFILRQLFRKISPNILHINNAGYPAALSARAAAIAGRLAGVPRVIMTVNNMALGYCHYSRWLDYPVDRLVTRSVDIFITGSLVARDRLRTVLKLPVHKQRAIHNGVTLRSSSSSVTATRQRLGLGVFRGVVFGVVALLVPRKGHLFLLEAILELVRDGKLKGDGFRILIEGSGPSRQTIVDFVIRNNLSPWITLVGDEMNIVDFMTALDVLILPSLEFEDFPNVILEAMALGKPVIASRLAGTPEQVLDGITGLLVEPRNVGQLSEAIFQLLVDDDLRKSMGRESSKRFNHCFSGQIAVANYESLYMELIMDRK